jgi:hypothetical protein
MIANGDAELGIVIIPNILNVPGAESRRSVAAGDTVDNLFCRWRQRGGQAAGSSLAIDSVPEEPGGHPCHQAKSMTPE